MGIRRYSWERLQKVNYLQRTWEGESRREMRGKERKEIRDSRIRRTRGAWESCLRPRNVGRGLCKNIHAYRTYMYTHTSRRNYDEWGTGGREREREREGLAACCSRSTRKWALQTPQILPIAFPRVLTRFHPFAWTLIFPAAVEAFRGTSLLLEEPQDGVAFHFCIIIVKYNARMTQRFVKWRRLKYHRDLRSWEIRSWRKTYFLHLWM
jgi:hypothetical protein